MNITEHDPADKSSSERVAAFVDGFNVYYGLRDKGFSRYYWLDYWLLAEGFIRPGQRLVSVSYFTSRLRESDGSHERQDLYLKALAATSDINIVEGTFRMRPMICPHCQKKWSKPHEKLTDTNLATAIVAGALRDEFDTCLVLCADSDVIPALRIAREAGKRILHLSPRGRHQDAIKQHADASLHIRNGLLAASQLPDSITCASGEVLRRPDHWC